MNRFNMMRIKYLLFVLCCSFMMWACDKIEGPYIVKDNTVETDVVFPPLDKNTVFQKILFEEYTGAQCTNCPNEGHRPLANLLTVYGDTLVPVCIHVGVYAVPTANYPYDFRTEYGNKLKTDFSISTLPCAVIQRTKYNGKYAVASPEWNNALAALDRTSAAAAIQMLNTFKDNKLTVNAKTTILSDIADKLVLMVVLTEDDVVAPQLDGADRIEEYHHQHVLRGAVTGNEGTFLTPSGIAEKDSAYVKSYLVDFAGKDWKKENCKVVAFLYNVETQEIVQVESAPIN